MGHLARFDLEGDDGVEVFEFGGGDGAGDEGGGSDEGGDSDPGGHGRGGGACRHGRGGWRTFSTREVSSHGAGHGRQGEPSQEPQANGDRDGGLGFFVVGVEGVDPGAIREV